MAYPEILSISAENQKADIAPSYGALLLRYSQDGRQILHCTDNWDADFPKSCRCGNPVLFPIASHVNVDGEANAYIAQGKKYYLAQHGFARHLPWQVIAHESAAVECRLVSTSFTLAMFPWDFELRLRYTLTGEGLISHVRITNLSKEPMPAHFGFHPYFQLDAPQSRHFIKTPAAEAVSLFAGPKSNPVKVEPGELLLTSSLSMTRLYERPAARRFELIHRESGRAICVESASEAFQCWAVWSPKIDAPFVCIEPWTSSPNAINHRGHLPVVQPSESLELEMTIYTK